MTNEILFASTLIGTLAGALCVILGDIWERETK